MRGWFYADQNLQSVLAHAMAIVKMQDLGRQNSQTAWAWAYARGVCQE